MWYLTLLNLILHWSGNPHMFRYSPRADVILLVWLLLTFLVSKDLPGRWNRWADELVESYKETFSILSCYIPIFSSLEQCCCLCQRRMYVFFPLRLHDWLTAEVIRKTELWLHGLVDGSKHFLCSQSVKRSEIQKYTLGKRCQNILI